MSSGTGQPTIRESAPSEQSAEARRAESIGALLDSKTSPKKQQRSETGSIYFFQTRRPLICLLFLLPLMLWYEIGKLALPVFSDGVGPAPGVVESWLVWLAGEAGLVLGVVIPILAVGMLLHMHHQNQESASVSLVTLAGMVAEVIGLSVILFLLGDAILLFVESQQPQPLSHLGDLFVRPQWHAVLLESLGAGLHEEILFRLVDPGECAVRIGALRTVGLGFKLSRVFFSAAISGIVGSLFVISLSGFGDCRGCSCGIQCACQCLNGITTGTLMAT